MEKWFKARRFLKMRAVRHPEWVYNENNNKPVYTIMAFGRDNKEFENKYIGGDEESTFREAERLAQNADFKYVRFYVMKSIGVVIPRHHVTEVKTIK